VPAVSQEPIAIAAIKVEKANLPELPNQPATATPIEEKTKKSLLDLLPMESDKKKSLVAFATTVATGVQEVKELKQNIQNSDITLKFGGKAIVSINL